MSNPRKIADTVYANLDTSIYKGKLINRSFSGHRTTHDQVLGNYDKIHSSRSWLMLYRDVALSYLDSNRLLSSKDMALKLFDFFESQENSNDDLTQPFGLIYHNLYAIDSSYANTDYFSANNGQLVPPENEEEIYSERIIKSAALLEVRGNSGYSVGYLKYDSSYVSVSDDIDLTEVKIDVGNGFERVYHGKKISYNRYQDSTVAYAAIQYEKDDQTYYDTIAFYLTLEVNETAKSGNEKAKDRWDEKYTWEGFENTDLKFRVAVKYGCGNDEKIRRPIIIAPPYRPYLQWKSMNSYYDQFSFKSLFGHLSNLGYDVIFIKEKPGNEKISVAGKELAKFIWEINDDKKQNYPNEDWENILMGFSAGGQHLRYALMYMEEKHMNNGFPHHHSRLYIPFDSPHHGANVPMMTQAVYYEMNRTWNPLGAVAYATLKDDASRDLLRHHIAASPINSSSSSNQYDITHTSTSSRTSLINEINNDFQHTYTPTAPNDQRTAFPAFTRNIGISTGRNDIDYETEKNLDPGKLVFEQDVFIPSWWGLSKKVRLLKASEYSINSTAFYRKELRLVALLVPVITQRRYNTENLYEWDMAQGGYKNNFFDDGAGNPVGILKSSAWFLGQQNYYNDMSFMPLVSSLALNEDIWNNNNLYYNLQDEDLMYQSDQDVIDDNSSKFYGYPNLAHPNNHFDITPFEAVFADQQTYEHIKMQESVDDNNLSGVNLVHLRNFIIEEVEADVVELQNQVIGENHLTWDPNFEYKAWYKAKEKIEIGRKVTPKTDPGDYIIENSGNITVHAGEEVHLKDGFHAKAGSEFHAFIYWDGCNAFQSNLTANDPPAQEKAVGEFDKLADENSNKTDASQKPKSNLKGVKIYPNPSRDQIFVELSAKISGGRVQIFNMVGKVVGQFKMNSQKQSYQHDFQKGVYIVEWRKGQKASRQKIIVL